MVYPKAIAGFFPYDLSCRAQGPDYKVHQLDLSSSLRATFSKQFVKDGQIL